jgi:hypothetical protein
MVELAGQAGEVQRERGAVANVLRCLRTTDLDEATVPT